jgi:hypothetical protein
VQIFGTNFDPESCGCIPWVSFGSIEYVSNTQVNVYYSENMAVGSYQIELETELGYYSNQATFTINGDPTPWISSISPATWTAGTTVQVNIYGSGFGTSPTLMISCCGIDSYPLTYVSDGLITANVTVDPYAPTENVTLTVVSNGYYGLGFVPQNQGQSNQGNAQAQVQNCLAPTLYVTGNGAQISVGQTVYVSAAPQMPAISASLTLPPPCVPTGTATFQLTTSYTVGGSAYPSQGPATLAANQVFSVPTSPFYGGQATITWAYNGASGTPFGFYILGVNPDRGTVQAALGGSGWPVNIGIHESGLQQFDPATGMLPKKDYAGGYGVMQLTIPAPTEDQKWNWQSNVAVGVAHLQANMSSGLSWLQSQQQQWSTWNQQNPNQLVGLAVDYWEGSCCIFSMQGTGTYTYDVAIGLKQYAGAPLPWGNFLSWYTNVPVGTTPYWSVSTANGVATDIVYQFATCYSLASCQYSGAGYPLGN